MTITDTDTEGTGTETGVEGQEEGQGGSDSTTLESLEEKVDRLAESVRAFLSGKKPTGTASKADDSAAVGQQVKEEVAKLQASEKAQGRETALTRRLDALEAKLAAAEKEPVEYRKVTQFLWGE